MKGEGCRIEQQVGEAGSKKVGTGKGARNGEAEGRHQGGGGRKGQPQEARGRDRK